MKTSTKQYFNNYQKQYFGVLGYRVGEAEITVRVPPSDD